MEKEKKKYKYPEAQARATKKYHEKTYSHFSVAMRKEVKAELDAYCQAQGKSVNGFINELVVKKLRREAKRNSG